MFLMLLRFRYDANVGLALEDMTRRAIEYEGLRYLGFQFGDQYLNKELSLYKLELTDYDEAVDMQAMVAERGLEELQDALAEVQGYKYTPLTQASEGFGYHSTTPVWCIVARETPTLFWRHGDAKAHVAAMIWIEYYAKQLSAGDVKIGDVEWPEPDKHNMSPVIPECFEKPRGRVPRGRAGRKLRMLVSGY